MLAAFRSRTPPLGVAVGTRGLVESAYWSTATDIGKERSGLVSGAMNSMSNLGGAVSTALAPILVAAFDWPIALTVAAGATALSGVLLYLMTPDQRSAETASLSSSSSLRLP